MRGNRKSNERTNEQKKICPEIERDWTERERWRESGERERESYINRERERQIGQRGREILKHLCCAVSFNEKK